MIGKFVKPTLSPQIGEKSVAKSFFQIFLKTFNIFRFDVSLLAVHIFGPASCVGLFIWFSLVGLIQASVKFGELMNIFLSATARFPKNQFLFYIWQNLSIFGHFLKTPQPEHITMSQRKSFLKKSKTDGQFLERAQEAQEINNIRRQSVR